MSGKQTTESTNAERAALKRELTVMISDLNEVRMRLDGLLRRISDSERLAARRSEVAARLDRIRERILTRLTDVT